MRSSTSSALDAVAWNGEGLVPAIAQDQRSGRVLMQAWMNREALEKTMAEGRAVYWSRSRQRLWQKGENSGCIQTVHEIRLDCDGDAILLRVEQAGEVACHTGHAACFYRKLEAGVWQEAEPVLRSPQKLYGIEDAQEKTP